MSFTCCNCSLPIERIGRRGPPPKRCEQCAKNREAAKRNAKKIEYSHVCEQCSLTFTSGRKKQACCSDICRSQRAAAQRKNHYHEPSLEPCKNPACTKNRKQGSAYCSKQCYKKHVRGPGKFCENPACRKKIDRPSQGPRKKSLGQDSGKYCCGECFHDHRWGADRPKKKWGKTRLAAAAAGALQTSLRKKCKVLNVPYDEECTRQAVLERDNYVCQECRINCNREYLIHPKTRKINLRNAEHDHIVPLTAANSPGNVFPNSQCLCRRCNNKKSDRSRGQLRLDIEGSVTRWENGARARRRRSSSSSGAIRAAVL